MELSRERMAVSNSLWPSPLPIPMVPFARDLGLILLCTALQPPLSLAGPS